MDFVAIDVETANSDLASICQIGVVSYSNGTPQRTWQCLVNPEDYFDPTNEAIHGITADMVKDSPTLAECHSELDGLLERQVVIHHTSFDRVALKRGAEKYRLPEFRCRWLDSARVVRRAWKECAERGYGLAPVAKMLGISFRHHDALFSSNHREPSRENYHLPEQRTTWIPSLRDACAMGRSPDETI